MDIQEYISSGVLEAYVLGDLSEQEVNEVERMAKQHSEIKDEIETIEEFLSDIAQKTAIQPPEGLKEQILDRLDQGEKLSSEEGTKEVKIGKTGTAWRYMVAASVTIAAVSLFSAINYYQKWKSTQEELDNLIALNQRLAENIDQVNRQNEDISQQLQILTNTDFNQVELRGLDISPQSLVLVYWNPSSNEVYLNVNSLPEPGEGKQYQLWAIVDGKPVDAGLLDLALSGLYKMKDISGAAAFAITLEPLGGSENPTLEAMYVIGNV